ncbi:MAG: hypothetical protein ACREJ9_10995 [Candidatus Rokuibacteriota bacterium]
MRGLLAPVMVLLLALFHAPGQAQALLFDFLPADWLQLGSSEPVTLILTGIALVSLGRVSLISARGPVRHGAPARRLRSAEPEISAETVPVVTKRAA